MSIPLIGAPKLSDAPLLPDAVLVAYLRPLSEALEQGADFNSPVSAELLILATALRDLGALRGAVRAITTAGAGGNPEAVTEALRGAMQLLPTPARSKANQQNGTSNVSG